MKKAKKKKELSPEFIERIMLGVTEVNGCEVCSYAHTKMALEQGMAAEEIQQLLAGSTDNIPVEEMPAYLFAQHYADRRGFKQSIKISSNAFKSFVFDSVSSILCV